MNDPIRELWARCVVKHTKTPMNWQNAADEFAELIMEEMYVFMCNATDNDKSWPSFKEVKKHFGVEE